MRIVRRALTLGILVAVLAPASVRAQAYAERFEVKKFTCGETLALSGEARARIFIYYNGYLDGRSGTGVWDDKTVGARIDRVTEYCKATPSLPLLGAFTRAWKS